MLKGKMDSVTNRKKKKILVLGAAPGAKLPPVDEIFSANAAAGYYMSEIQNNLPEAPINLVISASEIDFEGRVENPAKLEWLRKKLAMISCISANQIYLLNPDAFPQAAGVLLKSGPTGAVRGLAQAEISAVCEKVISRRIPLLTLRHFWESRNSPKTVLLNYLRYFLRRKIFTYELPLGLFRPSTGIIALLLALKEYGNEADYFLSGVSLRGARGLYPDGQDNSWSSLQALTEYHLITDRIFLELAIKKYDITVVA